MVKFHKAELKFKADSGKYKAGQIVKTKAVYYNQHLYKMFFLVGRSWYTESWFV